MRKRGSKSVITSSQKSTRRAPKLTRASELLNNPIINSLGLQLLMNIALIKTIMVRAKKIFRMTQMKLKLTKARTPSRNFVKKKLMTDSTICTFKPSKAKSA